jgi:hypothetical protein
MNMFGAARDSILKTAIQNHPLVQRLGTVHQLELDSQNHMCALRVGLAGEPLPLLFSVRYKIETSLNKTEFVIFRITCEKHGFRNYCHRMESGAP